MSKKILIGLSSIFLIVVCIFCFFSFNKKTTKNFLTLGIQSTINKDIKFSFSESKIFNYEGVTIPTITVQGISKKESITFKSFPFTIDDYKNHFKSAFSSQNLKTIKYDYKEIKIKNKDIDKIYESKAILNSKNKYSYVYLVSFKDRSGTLIIETSSKKDNNFKYILKNLKKINSSIQNIKYNYIENTNTNFKDIEIVNGIKYSFPNDCEIKKSTTSSAYYVNGFSKNQTIYIIASKTKPQNTTLLTWNNINGYEVIKEVKNGQYIIHDFNTQKIYMLETTIEERDSGIGTYYLRIEKLSPLKK